jgi:integrase
MGYVERRPDRPRLWRVRYRDPAGHERSRSFVRRTDADRFLHSVETDMVRGDWTDPRLGRLTFGDWSTSVEAGRVNVATSTLDNYRSVLRNLVLPTFGSVPVGAIEPGAIREWIADLVADGYSPSTIRRAYTLLREALELAVGDQMIPRSPCRNIALPKAGRTEMRFLTINEVEALADAIPATAPSF